MVIHESPFQGVFFLFSCPIAWVKRGFLPHSAAFAAFGWAGVIRVPPSFRPLRALLQSFRQSVPE